MLHWNNEWQATELEFCNLIHDNNWGAATLVETLEEQYKDRDVKLVSNKIERMVSVKDQGDIKNYGSLMFEYLMVNTDTNETRMGNTLSGQTHLYAVRFTESATDTFFVMQSKDLKDYLLYNRFESIPLQEWKRNKNRSELKRTFNHTLCWRVYTKDLRKQDWCVELNKIDGKWVVKG